MSYMYLKALHVVFVVTWFAGLFYIVRLFVYQVEALDRPEAERAVLVPQFALMAKRLWLGITWPSAIATAIFGGLLLPIWWPIQTWLWLKLGLVVGLFAYHGLCHALYTRLQRGERPLSSTALRAWNEVATVFLFGIVFLVELKDALGMAYGIGGFVLLTAVLLAGIAGYRRLRMRSTGS
jgi:putative membrane protein